MGAWGHTTFENDAACDWIVELENSENPREFLKDSLTLDELNEDYLDADVACFALAACETIAALNGRPGEDLPDELLDWIEEHKSLNVADLRIDCREIISRIVAPNSELKELWAENDEWYAEWKLSLRDLRKRI